MAYGASFGELYRRAASQVRKILQGVNPGSIPVINLQSSNSY